MAYHKGPVEPQNLFKPQWACLHLHLTALLLLYHYCTIPAVHGLFSTVLRSSNNRLLLLSSVGITVLAS